MLMPQTQPKPTTEAPGRWTVRPKKLALALAIGAPIALMLPGIPVAASLGWQWLRFQLNDEICIGYLDGEPVAAMPGACE